MDFVSVSDAAEPAPLARVADPGDVRLKELDYVHLGVLLGFGAAHKSEWRNAMDEPLAVWEWHTYRGRSSSIHSRSGPSGASFPHPGSAALQPLYHETPIAVQVGVSYELQSGR
jgi:hypothetical protein